MAGLSLYRSGHVALPLLASPYKGEEEFLSLQRRPLDAHCRVAEDRHHFAAVEVGVMCPVSEHAALVEHKPVLVAPRPGRGPGTLAAGLELANFVQPERFTGLHRSHRVGLAQML